jgi:hypothetical protein
MLYFLGEIVRVASESRFVSLLEEGGDGETKRTVALVKAATGDRDDQPFGI